MCNNMDIPKSKKIGLLINRRANIGSDIFQVQNQINQLNPRKEAASIIILQNKLQELQKEFAELAHEMDELMNEREHANSHFG